MFRVAWWLILAQAVFEAVAAAWRTLGIPAPHPIGSALVFYGVEFAVIAFLARRHLGDAWTELIPLRGMPPSYVPLVAVLALGGWVFAFQSVSFFQAINVLPPEVFDLAGGGSRNDMDLPLLDDLVASAVLPAVFEEVVGRGLVLSALAATMSTRRAIVISALFFAVGHYRIEHTLDTFIAGLVYGWMFVRTGSLLPSMLAHFLHNSVCVLIPFFSAWLVPWVDAYGLLPAWFASAGVALMVIGVMAIRLISVSRAAAVAPRACAAPSGS
jgi:membrane protease YdiL (CAAX protease family)